MTHSTATPVATTGQRLGHYSEVDADGLAVAFDTFRSWWAASTSAGMMRMTTPGLFEAAPALSDQFMMGILGRRFFLGIPEDVMKWFVHAPWMHVAVRPNFSGLALVCGKFGSGKRGIREFAIFFPDAPTEVVSVLSSYHYIDVRPIVGGNAVSKMSAMTLEVVPVHGDLNFETFASGASAAAFHISQAAQRRAA